MRCSIPVYCHRCPKCGAQTEEIRPMAKSYEGPFCSCFPGIRMDRDFMAEQVNSPDKEFYTPIVSDSLSVGADPRDVRAYREKYPDMTITDIGQPVFYSRSEKLRHLKAEGFEERS